MGSPFILPRAGAPKGPPGFPPDVAPNQIIAAAHINAIRDSAGIWPGNVDGNAKTLANVAAAGIGTPAPESLLDVRGAALQKTIIMGRGGDDANFQVMSRNGSSGTGLGSEQGRIGLTYMGAPDTWNAGVRFLRGAGAADGFFALDTSGTERMRIESDGRVQIGPDLGGTHGTLDIYRSTSEDNYLRLHHSNVGEIHIGLNVNGNAYLMTPTTNLFIGSLSAVGAVEVWAGNGPRMIISAAGKITMGNGSADAFALSGRVGVTVPDNTGIAVYHATNGSTGRLAIRQGAGLSHFVLEGWDGSAYYSGFGCADGGYGVFISGRYTDGAALPNSTWACQIDEPGNRLFFRAKYADGTIKSGFVNLV